MNEYWTEIKGYEGKYLISNLGNVKSKKYNNEKILKPYLDKDGYLYVRLSKNNKQTKHSIHRLVCEHFIVNDSDYPIINHKDENKTNNNINNLEWCSYSYNNSYGNGNKSRKTKLSKRIIGINANSGLILEFNSAKESEQYGFNRKLISMCCNNIRNIHKGYIWRFV